LCLGWAYELRGDTERATECYERVLATTEAHGESAFRSYALWGVGVARWRQGDLDRARRSAEDGLRLIRSFDDPVTGAAYLETLSWIAWSGDQMARAAVLLGAADSLRRSLGFLLFPQILVHHDECEQGVRRSLGEQAFASAHHTGESMSFREAAAYGLGEEPGSSPAPNGAATTRLTKRERQVADLVAEGLTNKAIATRLAISPRTVDGHVEHIMAKLGFGSRAQIATWVVKEKQEPHS
jgi:non-specific serine/threonine protein kinase